MAFRSFQWGSCSFRSRLSRFIGQPLALHADQQIDGAVEVIHAQRLAIAVAEIELVQVALQVMLGNVVIGANNAALENSEVGFYGVAVC